MRWAAQASRGPAGFLLASAGSLNVVAILAPTLPDREISEAELVQSLPHAQLSWNTPLSVSHADRLLGLLEPHPGTHFLDLGCGWAGLLLRALGRYPGTTGTGVDRNRAFLERAGFTARALGLVDRVRLLEEDISEFTGTGDRVICIGADHAWASQRVALAYLGRNVEEGGRLLFGSGFWERIPTPELVEMFGELPGSFEALLATARSAGWVVRHSDSADLIEWDAFEKSWRQDLEDLSERELGTPPGALSARLLARRVEEYERGYRGVLGLAYLVLERVT